jgi:alkylation response protein AidB-like acyl-CoA dehydrogenase
MFDLELTDEQEALCDTVRAFAIQRVRPGTKQRELESELHQLGLAMPVPEEFGGQGVPDPLTYLVAAEALAYGDPGVAFATMLPGHAALFIGACGTPDQQAEWLPTLSKGKTSVLLHEGFGRTPSELRTAASRQGSTWVLNGRKDAVVHPGAAALSVVIARDAGTAELIAFVLEGRPPGLQVARDDRDTGTLGLEAAHTGAVTLQGVTLEESARLPADASAAVCWYRLTVGAIALGAAAASFDYAADYANQRVAFGKPIAAFEAVSFMLVDMNIAIEAARLGLWKAAWALDQPDPHNDLEASTNRAVTKACATAQRAARDALQVLGGAGFLKDHPVERWYRATAALWAIEFDPTQNDLLVS